MIFSNSVAKKLIISVGSVFSIILALLHLFLGSTSGPIYKYAFTYTPNAVGIISWFVLGFVGLTAIFSFVALIMQLLKKKMKVSLLVNACFSLIAMVLSIVLADINNIYPCILFGLNLILAIYATVYEIRNKEEEFTSPDGAIFAIVIALLTLGSLFSLFFIPVCFYDGVSHFRLVDALSETATVECLVSFVSFFVLFIGLLLYFTQILVDIKNINKFLSKTRGLVYSGFILAICFYLFSIIISFVDKSSQTTTVTKTTVIAYIPLLLMAVIAIVNSVLSPRFSKDEIEEEKEEKEKKSFNSLITFLFTLTFVGLLVGALFSNILVISYTSSTSVTNSIVTVNGFDVLKNFKNMDSEYKTLAFFIYLIIAYAICACVLTTSLFFRKSKFFYKFSFFTVFFSFLLLFVLAFFGKHYEIDANIQIETIEKILEEKGISLSVDYTCKVTTQTIYYAIAALALMVVMICFKPFTNKLKEEAIDVNVKQENPSSLLSSSDTEKKEEPILTKKKDFQPCPAFHEIDEKEELYLTEIKRREKFPFENPSLPSVVHFIVEYARDSRLHLSYKEEDIAQFVAGLGSSKLSILQGMSGTGKTSLPKIFSEAIFGDCDIIEVESSWKDKNELIGYYNEFSSKFTPKKFTQSLYKAKFMPDTIHFIVLDEMNLSRIEYYFSDFLSLMENEEDKREINLLNVQLKEVIDGEEKEFKQLVDGHVLKIPTNVWFIGTANRDESTFEISDKVYDRAMTMNFTKRASKVRSYEEPLAQRYLTYPVFIRLLNQAKNSYHFDCESSDLVKEVEKIVAPFNISFGNRIMNQIESFVSIYCSCFLDPHEREKEALEKILLTKVVQKLEFKSVENKDELVHAFEGLGLYRCSNFISSLNEDI